MRIAPHDRIRANKIIGYTLRSIREHDGITQSQVAERLHCTQAFVSMVENGNRSIKLVEAIMYSHGIGVSSQELYEKVKHALAEEGLVPYPANKRQNATPPDREHPGTKPKA